MDYIQSVETHPPWHLWVAKSQHMMVIYQKVSNFRETSSKIREDNTLEIFTIWSVVTRLAPNSKYFQCRLLISLLITRKFRGNLRHCNILP